MIEVLNLSALVLRDCFKKLFQAFFLILFFGSTFILLGKQLYKGVLTQKCVTLPPFNISDSEYSAFVSNSSNWLENKGGYYLCGNSTGSRPCPENFTCLKASEVNTYISHFNFYGSSVVTISQLMTLHFWQELYQKMLLTAGTLHVTYFVLAFYSFLYSSGLILAIITRSYRNVLKEFQVVEKKSRLATKDTLNTCDSQKGIVRSPSCKSYELFSSQIINTERVERQAAEIIESTSRAADKSFDSDNGLRDHLSESKAKRDAVRCQLASRLSNESPDQSNTSTGCLSTVRQHLRPFAAHCMTELFFLTSVTTYLCITIAYYSRFDVIPSEVILVCYYIFAIVTFLEVVLKVVAFTPSEFFRSKWNAFDCVVLVMGSTELFLLDVQNPVLFTLRTYKLVKLMICCNTFNYLKETIGSCLFLFRHAMQILVVFITICIVTGMQLYGYEYFHSEDRFPDQKPPRWFFKDFYSSFLLVFCMLCGDWKQPMVNTVLFTSYASDLLMLIFVLVGNFVVLNLFLGIVFFKFFYKSLPKSSGSKDKLQNAIQVILNKQGNVSEGMTNAIESKSNGTHHSVSSSSEPVSTSRGSLNHSYNKIKRQKAAPGVLELAEDTVSSEYVADCCPALCYFCCGCCKADENPVLWQKWADVRCGLYWLVETRAFRFAVAIIIVLGTVVLILEQSHESTHVPLAPFIKVLNPTIFLLFLFEMVLKWMAYGLHKFFKSYLGRLEFFIIMVYAIDLLSIKLFDGQGVIFKALRAFRLISLTSLLKSYQETVPLPMKQQNNCAMNNEVTTSNESLLRQLECKYFLGKRCRYRPTGSGEIFQMDWNVPEVHPCNVDVSKMRRIEQNLSDDYRNRNPVADATNCLPDCCYSLVPLCKRDCCFFKFWTILRTKCVLLVQSKCFFGFMLLVILISCGYLAVELNFSTDKPQIVEDISLYANRVFASLFLFEMLLKIFALGFKRYFTNCWYLIEFITTLLTTSYIVFHEFGFSELAILKNFKVVRLLNLCKILNFNKQSKAILTSLKRALLSYILVFLFVFYMWLVFAIIGTAMFSGKLHECVDVNNNIISVPGVACGRNNGTYKNSPVNFDSVQNAFIALLQVATLQNWMSFVTSIMDNSNSSNVIKSEFYTAIFFPTFILFSTFLTLNFFVGVTCWYFNDQKRETENALSCKTNMLYKAAINKIGKIKLQRTIPAPKLQFQMFLYRMVSSDNFEIAGFVFIGLHMLLIALDMYDPSPSEIFALAMTELNVFFIVIFTVEIILKLAAYSQHYFKSLWNLFDVVVLGLCICGILFEELFSSPMLPAMLRLIRFLKCRRYLRRYVRGMLPLLYSLYASIPAFTTILIVQFIVMFIYAVFGVYLFHGVRQSWDISGELSFETFPKAMLLLFQLSTLAGWIDVLYCLSESGQNLTSATIFVVSYIIVVYYIIIKTHLIVILDSFNTTMHEYENILLKEDYEMFVEVWQRFDTKGHGVIKFGNLPDLLDVLEEPFHFGKPNRYLIATLNIPIYEGDLIFYADVMDALTRDFMTHKAHLIEAVDSIPGLLDKKGNTLKKTGSSLWRQRQNHCAYVIQRAWRKYSPKMMKSPVFYSEVRLADQGDKVDTVLSAEIRCGSHVSV